MLAEETRAFGQGPVKSGILTLLCPLASRLTPPSKACALYSTKSSPGLERLQKIISRAGLASRREAERWILEGRVSVNGAIISKLGSQADPAKDSIKVDGKRIKPAAAPLYFAFHKPPGGTTTLKDPTEHH